MPTHALLAILLLAGSAPAPTHTGARGPDQPAGAACALREVKTLIASDGETADWFGYSLAVSGDTIVVGAYGDDVGGTNNQGSVHVFARPPGGGWPGAVEVARLTASDAFVQDQFGRAVAISGDTIVVGAYGDEGYQGSAYVFVKPPGGWADATQTAKLTASDGEGFDYFGASVAIDGGTIVVGAPLDDVTHGDQGSAYVFVEPPGGWADATETAKLTASDGEINDNLGQSVGVSGGTAVAGAPNDDVGGVTSRGSAYVFVEPPGGWSSVTQTARLVASDGAAGDHLGAAIGVSGGTVVGGAPDDDAAGNLDQGSAYVFVEPPGGWADAVETAKLTASDGDFGDELGTAVAVAGHTIVAGAPDHDIGGEPHGAAFVFLEPPQGWATGTESQKLSAAGGALGDELGFSVAVDADTVAAGSLYTDVGDVPNQGSVTVFAGPRPPTRGRNWSAQGNQVEASFGQSVASAGDVNGDGYLDVIVGAPFYDNGQSNEGRAVVYHGSSSGLAKLPSWTAEADQIGTYFGWSVASAGDVNGDGYADVIVGAYWYDNGQSNEGRAFVYHGSPSGLSTVPNWTAESGQAFGNLGYSVASAGDVNGDGYADVIVGAVGISNGQADEGAAFTYHGSPSGLSTVPNWMVESNHPAAYFGQSVASAGDVNDDGYADVIVGASGYDNGQADEGKAFVYHGSPTGLSISAAWTAESDQANAYFGGSVASAGDVNGDGYGDVVVGAPFYDNGEADEGRAFVYHGAASGLSTDPAWTAESNQVGAYFGRVASAGDENGDGYADVVVGASLYDNGQADEGTAFVYRGSASGLSTCPIWKAEINQASALSGWSAASAGDVNGDGYADVVVGAYLYDRGQANEGVAVTYHGRP